MKKEYVKTVAAYGIGLALSAATIGIANSVDDSNYREYQYAVIEAKRTANNPVMSSTWELIAEAKKQNPDKSLKELSEMLTAGAAEKVKNVQFTPELVERVKQAYEVGYQAVVNMHDGMPTNERLDMLLKEFKRFMDSGHWVEAEILIPRIEATLTPEQRALVAEAFAKDHKEKKERGEYSLYEDYLKKGSISDKPIMTPEEARAHTVAQIKEHENLRKIGGHQRAPQVDFKDFGINGFEDIDPFKFKKVGIEVYNEHIKNQAPKLPVYKTTPQDLRGRQDSQER